MSKPFKNRTDWLTRLAWGCIFGFGFIAIFANLIANDHPIYATKNGKTYWPVFQSSEKHSLDYSTYDHVIYPPIPFRNQGVTNLSARLKPPGTKVNEFGRIKYHLLGTDRLGRDVAAGLVYGSRKSLMIAIVSISLALLVGVLLGALAGYWGNKMPIRLPWYTITLGAMGSFYVLFLLYYHSLISAMIVGLLLLSLITVIASISKAKTYFPMDAFVLRLIELFQSVPGLLILMVVAALVKQPSLLLLSMIIA